MENQIEHLDTRLIKELLKEYYPAIFKDRDSKISLYRLGGFRGFNYHVRQDEDYVLKVIPEAGVLPWNHIDNSQLEATSRIQNKLADRGLPVQTVFKTQNATLATQIYLFGTYNLVLLEYLEGHPMLFSEVPNHTVFEDAIECIRELTKTLKEFPVNLLFQKDPHQHLRLQLEYYNREFHYYFGLHSEFIKENDPQADSLAEKWSRFYKELDSFLRLHLDFPVQLVHADLTVPNILFKDDKISGILDFDKMHVGFLEEEWANFAVSWLSTVDHAKEYPVDKLNSLLPDGINLELYRLLSRLYLWKEYYFFLGMMLGEVNEGRKLVISRIWNLYEKVSK